MYCLVVWGEAMEAVQEHSAWPAPLVQPVWPWLYWTLREGNCIAWILTRVRVATSPSYEMRRYSGARNETKTARWRQDQHAHV